MAGFGRRRWQREDYTDHTCLILLQEDLENGEDVATCPSCSLIIKVIYDKVREHILKGGRRVAMQEPIATCLYVSAGECFLNSVLGKCYVFKNILKAINKQLYRKLKFLKLRLTHFSLGKAIRKLFCI